jgi:hypothetical protein
MATGQPPRGSLPGRSFILRRRHLLGRRPAAGNPLANPWGTRKVKQWSKWLTLGLYGSMKEALEARAGFILAGGDHEQQYLIVRCGIQQSKITIGIQNKAREP